MRSIRRIVIVFVICVIPGILFSQGDIEDLLYTEVDNLNPVYKPVIGFGIGTFNFFGDVRDANQNPLNGTLGYKVNISTFIDNKHIIRANFFFMLGTLSGNERSYVDLNRNMNFKSDILLFGVNLNYDFDNFYKKYRRVHPFISVGFEVITFNSKIDSFANITFEGVTTNYKYHYGPDGNIYDRPYTELGIRPIQRDYNYETDLRQYDWGLGDYPQYGFAIPVDIGLDFWLSDRIMLRLATSYHFTFTDVIDHVSSKNDPDLGVVGDKRFDDFMYTYLSLHLDLFSSKKTLAVQRLFADVELDLTLIGDEDNDGYMDGWDKCPDTPFGVETDTAGCPLDDDYDEIPNYLDDEPLSRYGAYVDERGVEISEDDLIVRLDMSNAVSRDEVELYLRTPSSYSLYEKATYEEIPEKFKKVDADGDGYISFDEILDEIDNYFDFESDLESDDIYELNNFFFSQ